MAMCRCGLATKSMTGKTAEGLASGRALNTGGVWQNTFKINLVYFAKRQGLKPCGCFRWGFSFLHSFLILHS